MTRSQVWQYHATGIMTWLLLSQSTLAVGADGPNPTVAGYVAEARAAARAEYNVELHLDTRDVENIATILSSIRDRHAQASLPSDALARQVRRWGAVLGEIQRSVWAAARWGRSEERNRAYAYSVYIPLEGGGWLESNEFDLVEGFITKPRSKLTIQQALALHFLD